MFKKLKELIMANYQRICPNDIGLVEEFKLNNTCEECLKLSLEKLESTVIDPYNKLKENIIASNNVNCPSCYGLVNTCNWNCKECKEKAFKIFESEVEINNYEIC